MPNETTSPYRTYLEELARRTHEADPDFSVQEVLVNPRGGFGQALDAAISLTEEEKDRLTRAWVATFIPPRS